MTSFEETLTLFARNSVSVLLDNMAPSIIDFTMQYIFRNPGCVAEKNHITIILDAFKASKMPSYPASTPAPTPTTPVPVPVPAPTVTPAPATATVTQCQALKKDNTQCSKKAKKNELFCGIHCKDPQQKTVQQTPPSASVPAPVLEPEPQPEPQPEPEPSSKSQVPLPVPTTITPDKPYPGPVRGAIPRDFNRVPDINLCHNGDFIILKNYERTVYYDFLDEGYRPVGAIEPGSPDIKWDSRSVLESIRTDFDRKKELAGKNVKWGPK